LIAAVALSIFLGGLSSTLPWDKFLSYPMTRDFGWRVAYPLPGAFVSNPYPYGVNGSLWTLPVELRLYVGVAILGCCGILARRGVYTIVLATLITTYTVLVLAYHPRVQAPRFNRSGDYSYGLYVYAFPIQQTIMLHAPRLTTVELLIPAFLVTLAVAAVSWHFLEHPILGLKSRFA
jgi:peptidoglycan/LPS O-acetylase OafA/YrhL